jgi:hypothetical protein
MSRKYHLSVASRRLWLRFKENRWGKLGMQYEALCGSATSILLFKFLHWPSIKSPHRAGTDADGFQPLHQSFEAKVTLLHLSIFLFTKLGGIIRTFLCTKSAAIPTEAGLVVDDHYAIIFSLLNRPGRAGLNATGVEAMVATSYQERDI